MKNIAVLGSTGSIGTQTLDIISRSKDMRVSALSCGKNISLLEAQIRDFSPDIVCVEDEEDADILRRRIDFCDVEIVSGLDGLIKISEDSRNDTVVTAIVGMIGLKPTVAAIKSRKTICLANKETLVTAGHIIMPLAKEYGVDILPVDSEHSAIFQSLLTRGDNEIESIILTASGGPFRGYSKEALYKVKLEDALKHPNWNMGKKITIDSATMVNKGLEVIEARWLFDVSIDKIKVVIHPQSILHSAIEYVDGAIIGQMGIPDMHLPISYALNYPKRIPLGQKPLSLTDIGELTFEKPDMDTFKGLALGYKAIRQGGNMPVVYNAANECAVKLFLERKISFLDITALIERMMGAIAMIDNPSIDEIISTQKKVTDIIGEYI